jgi:hypothetical protein
METIKKYYWIMLILIFSFSMPAKAQRRGSITKSNHAETELKNEQKREKVRRNNAKAAERTQEKGDDKAKYKAITKKRKSVIRKSEKREEPKFK